MSMFMISCANFRTWDKSTKYGTIIGTVIGASIVGRIAHVNTNDRILPSGFIGGAMLGWTVGKLYGKVKSSAKPELSSEYDKKIGIISSDSVGFISRQVLGKNRWKENIQNIPW